MAAIVLEIYFLKAFAGCGKEMNPEHGVCSCWGGGPCPKYDLVLETSYYSALDAEPLGALAR